LFRLGVASGLSSPIFVVLADLAETFPAVCTAAGISDRVNDHPNESQVFV
jgi:hypothetical protein